MRPAGVAVEQAADFLGPGLWQALPGGGKRPHSMDLQVTLNVTFRNETQSFLVSDPENTTWADVEAMVKVSFDLNTVQIKYLDEENEEISINSQGEYEEALKMAVKQGNQLQMQVHEGRPHPTSTLAPAPALPGAGKHEASRPGKKQLVHYSSVARVVGSDLRRPREPAPQPFPLAPGDADHAQDGPPDWFTSYLETFREQVVRETVEKLEQKLQEKLVLQSPSLGSCASDVSVPAAGDTLFLPENLFSWHIACSSCRQRIVGVRYQCSLCRSYNICEDCEAGPYAHDANHVLLKLRRPVLGTSELASHTKPSAPRLPAALEQVRLQKQVDKNFLKAEKQRLRAEKKQRKAEVKELKKQLKLHRKIHLWNSIHALQSPKSSLGRAESLLQPSALRLPAQPGALVLPTFSAAFVDENLPDGTRLQPGTRFIKHWRMKNTGTVNWSTDTKLKFMWGNLTLVSAGKKDVLVPFLEAGHVGVVSVEFVAPALEGTYTSHWRLTQSGRQFGPRVWCSIVVDPSAPAESLSNSSEGASGQQEEAFLVGGGETPMSEVTAGTGGTGACILQKTKIAAGRERELYIPSVDLLSAQDLLSFELLDMNIARELERVPHNTPVDTTPCMSPLPHDGPFLEKPGLGQIQEESEGAGRKAPPGPTAPEKRRAETAASGEDTEEDLSGTQFVCETVIRSLTLDAAPDHNPPCKQKALQLSFTLPEEGLLGAEEEEEEEEEEETEEEGLGDEVQSQPPCSLEDYVIILPECFDTSRPLGDSVYSSALSQPGLEAGQEPIEAEAGAGAGTSATLTAGESPSQGHSLSDVLAISQTLDAVSLAPEMVGLPPAPPRQSLSAQHGPLAVDAPAATPEASAAPSQVGAEPRGCPGPVNSRQKSCDHTRHPHGSSIAGGLVKGALSVAASAYKALFSGPPVTAQPVVSEHQTAALMAHLFEMGFCDRQLNLRLLRKHDYSLLQVVTELLQISNNDWYSHRY
ncbi:next to BRCA1 gene 1 protein isoform X2 [Fukomys damarensis]|uniref:next to BRCA1 gene 1 protein isoform X2 n=1 Tax=Fukomys damarensis TaxID=885580 RepID=UPI00053F2EAE|nr:next to BRCA1 gene 1 protein isoform X2 [Fukomys damarensis]